MSLKMVTVMLGAAGSLMLLAPAANAAPVVIDGGQNIQWCGNIHVDEGATYAPHNSPNFVKCLQVSNVENHPFFAGD